MDVPGINTQPPPASCLPVCAAAVQTSPPAAFTWAAYYYYCAAQRTPRAPSSSPPEPLLKPHTRPLLLCPYWKGAILQQSAMNGVSRFLSRRDKNHEKRSLKHPLGKSRHAPPSISPELYSVFTNDEKPVDKDADKRKTLLQRLQAAGINTMQEEQVNYALSWSPDNVDEAYDLLVLANETLEGELKEFDADVPMLGAINRNMVTCYLDALLFAMFARMDSFEAMLYDEFNDEPRKKLAAILRLWVNLLRTGRLIRVDFTKRLQDALAQCGWEEAAEVRQQDASEAFTFITGALELPLLTLKMDIYHTGREDREDDHKFVNERLLEVAIPEEDETDKGVTLEDCLENYFNNRIEVKRYLQRQNTLPSVHTTNRDNGKKETLHIETIELAEPETPLVATPTTFGPPSPVSPVRPLAGRRRGDSIFSERYSVSGAVKEYGRFDEKKHLQEMLDKSSSGRPRSASLLRKEVMMPAWQFFSLIPWYTDNVPKTDAQVAAHFASKRPVLGICLKRYMMLPNGTTKRLNTYVDIPLEIGLPHFISDERMHDEGPLFGNFKLVLQSVVCHRGVSVDSGHYVSLVRANKSPTQNRPTTSNTDKEDDEDSWLRFDDLSNPRVVDVDIQKALREESPYLLFYQVQPIDEELANRGDPPSYDEAQSVTLSAEPSKETLSSETDATATDTDTGEWERINHIEPPSSTVGSVTDFEAPGRTSMSSNRRSSIANEDLDNSVSNIARGRPPPTPDEQRTSFLSASRRNSKAWLSGNKSRPSSESGENRLSITLSRLTGRGSKDKLVAWDSGPEDPVIVKEAPLSVESTQTIKPQAQPVSPGKLHKDAAVSRSKSKKHFRSKSREPVPSGTEGGLVKGKHIAKKRPERECVLM
ncbi:cysteine proteinase [Karstenula rhodostoma CBS 690.94]|uniref:ubiquitinyl hydrolase 1 n=1 Tax=Karstenula rhodostoma CBS 690.94 TaxID=1392251 RepID=A0A9P4UDP7_9PLEO|nr:cysteine proteinase [Karstenula rhodostoma CBS 690.94]